MPRPEAQYGSFVLLGRRSEQRLIDELLESARAGTSAALVILGEPGIGKTALLEDAAQRASGFNVVRARGVESDAELPFGGLLEVCRPLLGRLDALEPQQAAALRAALGLAAETAPTPFAVGAATLSVLAAAAEEQPLLLLVDDAHWLDRSSADALSFAVRRLHADAVAALFAARPREGRPFAAVEFAQLELSGLAADAADELFTHAHATSFPPDERAQVLETAAGNPLALLELPRHRDDSFGGEPIRLGKQLERAFASRALGLPKTTQRALVVAAATSGPDLVVLRRALENEGLSIDALEPAERDELVTLSGATFEFRHPLVRSAVYHAADPAERRRAHAALAAALGGDDRAAWHLAAATVGPDERAAIALERVAETASRRSGMAAAAAAYERAARLTEDSADRLRRLTAAADAAWLAGRTPQARAFVEEALAHAEDGARRGRLLALLGSIEHFAGNERAASTLEDAARLLVDVDPRQACATLNLAVGSSLMKGQVDRAVAISERAFAIADIERPDQQLFVSLSRGASLLMAGRPEEGLRFLMRSAAADDDELFADAPRELPFAALVAFWLGDAELMARRAARAVAWAREHAAVATLAFSARLLARAQLITGHWRAARASLAESLDAARISEQPRELADTLITLAWLDAAQGRADECRVALSEATEISEQQNLQWQNGLVRAVLMLEFGLGLHEGSEGASRVRDAIRERTMLRDTPANATMPEVVEALVRIGARDEAEALLEPFADEAERIGQPYPRAAARRCRALLADDASYADLFEDALAFHREDSNVFAEARTQLAYGERLRRSGERIAARAHLHSALAVFEHLEAEPWAARGRAEIRATGERLRRRDVSEREELTPQELQIALVVAEGKTNREVGAQLFLSPKTVEWHLGHIYRKLGVRSRAELARELSGSRA
jgi:DNA-binding CsgD family transcriptional regulator/tetratricopeptide (TPR) repeat protein